MGVDVKRQGRTLVVRIDGELDLHTSEDFKSIVNQAIATDPGLCNLILLMQDVTFVDSSGVGAILGRYRALAARGGRVAVVGLQAPVRRVLEFSGMLRIMPTFATEREALARL